MKRNVFGNRPNKEAMATPTSPKFKTRPTVMDRIAKLADKKALKAKKSRGNNSK